MIELTDCIRAISGVLETKFGAPPLTKDIFEGFERPATFLYPGAVRSAWEGLLRHDTYEFNVVRFAGDLYSGYVSLLANQTKLTEVLSVPITATGNGQSYRMMPEELSFQFFREDMAVEASFRVELFQTADEPGSPAEPSMEELVMDEDMRGV